MISLFPYIGGKHRMAGEIAKRLHATGADLATLFRVLADPKTRADLHERLRWTPACRRIFDDDHAVYLRGGFSFALIVDPIERARATLHRQLLAWGGKGRNGGFSLSTGDRLQIKEVLRYQNVLDKLEEIGEFFRGTGVENLDYQDCIAAYGKRTNCVLYCDPPYDGTEGYYSHAFGRHDHVYLAHLVTTVPAPAVLTYYDSPLIRELYPDTLWRWETVIATGNCQLRHGNKPKTAELILTKRMPEE